VLEHGPSDGVVISHEALTRIGNMLRSSPMVCSKRYDRNSFSDAYVVPRWILTLTNICAHVPSDFVVQDRAYRYAAQSAMENEEFMRALWVVLSTQTRARVLRWLRDATKDCYQ
jgi:hypothetical protein